MTPIDTARPAVDLDARVRLALAGWSPIADDAPAWVFAACRTLSGVMGAIEESGLLPDACVPIHRSLRLEQEPRASKAAVTIRNHRGRTVVRVPCDDRSVEWRLLWMPDSVLHRSMVDDPLDFPPSAIWPVHRPGSVDQLLQLRHAAIGVFCDVIGDPNPVHHDLAYSRAHGLTAVAAPGSLLATLLLKEVHRAGRDAGVITIRFKRWVLADEPLRFRWIGPTKLVIVDALEITRAELELSE